MSKAELYAYLKQTEKFIRFIKSDKELSVLLKDDMLSENLLKSTIQVAIRHAKDEGNIDKVTT